MFFLLVAMELSVALCSLLFTCCSPNRFCLLVFVIEHRDVVVRFDLEHLYDCLAQLPIVTFIDTLDYDVGDNWGQTNLAYPSFQSF